jgi:hypothetical protein
VSPVVVVDANVLLYAVNEDAPHHEAASRWLESALNADEPVGFAWIALLAFLRVATLVGMTEQPLAVGDALDLIDDWLAAPAAAVVAPTSRHAGVLRGLLLSSGSAGNLTNDAHLGALAVEHGARICTFDRDFTRFDGVSSFAPN